MKSLLVVALLLLSGWAQAGPALNVLTYHNDLARTGLNSSETILTPANVGGGKFGFLYEDKVDGQVYGQPLYVSGLTIPGKGLRNVLFVTTEHDSVYAFDADLPGAPLWEEHFTGLSNGITITTVPIEDLGGCSQITPEIGITDTPVIDPETQTLYLVAMTKEIPAGGEARYFQRLHALDITTGKEKFGGPVEIKANVPGTTEGNTFNPRSYKERCGLVLTHGVVYTFWASHCDFNNWGPYHGWIIGYDAKSLRQKYVFNSTPNGSEASLWASGAAPALDAEGRMFLMTGNGTYDGMEHQDWGDSFLRFDEDREGTFKIADSFTPTNQAELDANDKDLGSGGPLLLPDDVGSKEHPHLLVGGGKDGVIYLVDRDQMGGYHPTNRSVQALTLPGRLFGVPAYFHHWLYFGLDAGKITRVKIDQGALSMAVTVGPVLAFPGSVPSLSSNGEEDGILWVVVGSYKRSRLSAYDAASLKLLYQKFVPGITKFVVPTIVNGKVYIGGIGAVKIFGLLPGDKSGTQRP